jgi:hypothetical protein
MAFNPKMIFNDSDYILDEKQQIILIDNLPAAIWLGSQV